MHVCRRHGAKEVGVDGVGCQFIDKVKLIVKVPKRGMIVAWNGKSCDMEWIYRVTLGIPEGNLNFVHCLDSFLHSQTSNMFVGNLCISPRDDPTSPNTLMEEPTVVNDETMKPSRC